MTDLPYTEDDLLIEAARQHLALTEDPDFGVVGKQMDDDEWRSLSADEFNIAQRRIHSLINAAADVSEWAVHLGADGLEPLPERLTAHMDYSPWFRLHFAVRPDMPDDMRRSLVEGVGAEIAKHVLWHENRGGYEPGSFTKKLLDAWSWADDANAAHLEAGWPEYAAAFRLMQQRDGNGVD